MASGMRLLCSRFLKVAAWTLLVIGVAVAINLVGIHALGDVHGWQRWLRVHRGLLLVWRLCLYAATAYGWWHVRNRLCRRDGASEDPWRFRRAEIAAVTAVALLEASMWLR